MNFGCDLMKPLTNTRFAAINWIKSLSGGYRQIMNLKDIDVCKVLSHLKDFPMFQGQVDWLNTTFPGFAHPCPYTVRNFYTFLFISIHIIKSLQSFKVFNASLQPNDDRSKYDVKLPNGSYKVKFQGSDDSDDNIFQLTFYYEVRYHFNVFDFK